MPCIPWLDNMADRLLLRDGETPRSWTEQWVSHIHPTVMWEIAVAVRDIDLIFDALVDYAQSPVGNVCVVAGGYFQFDCVDVHIINHFRVRFDLEDVFVAILVVIAHHDEQDDPEDDVRMRCLACETLPELLAEIKRVLVYLTAVPLAHMLRSVV